MRKLNQKKLDLERGNFKKSDLTFINYGDCNLLMVSIQVSNFERSYVLIENGIDLNFKTKNGFTALHFLAENYHKEIALAILNREVYVDATNKYLNSPLMSAIANGQYEYAEMLIKYGADLDLKNYTGLTPRQLIELHIERFPDNESIKLLRRFI